MDEYLIVPKSVLNEQKLTQIQLNSKVPEAAEIVDLENLTAEILRREDLSEWQKADLLAKTLERFLALRPIALDEPTQPEFRPKPGFYSTILGPKVIRKDKQLTDQAKEPLSSNSAVPAAEKAATGPTVEKDAATSASEKAAMIAATEKSSASTRSRPLGEEDPTEPTSETTKRPPARSASQAAREKLGAPKGALPKTTQSKQSGSGIKSIKRLTRKPSVSKMLRQKWLSLY